MKAKITALRLAFANSKKGPPSAPKSPKVRDKSMSKPDHWLAANASSADELRDHHEHCYATDATMRKALLGALLMGLVAVSSPVLSHPPNLANGQMPTLAPLVREVRLRCCSSRMRVFSISWTRLRSR